MLRVAVIALVLVNLVLLALQALDPGRAVTRAPTEAPDPSNGVPGLVLLSEMAVDAPLSSGSAECFTAGPFESEDEREAARRLIAPSSAAMGFRQTVATVDRGTWVYLPVQPDYVTARSMALTLRDAGFADSSVVRDGEWANSVSLGYFLSESNAERIFTEARSFGFPVETRTQQNMEPRYWIDYEQRVGVPYVEVSGGGPVSPERHRFTACGSSNNS